MRRRILALLLAIVMCAALSLPAGAALFPTIVEKDGAYYLVDYDYETGEYEITYLYGHIHKFGNWVVTRMPTCTMTGQQYHTCLICRKTYWEDIPRLPHSWGGWTVTVETTDHSAGQRVHTCRVCGTSETETFYPQGTLKLYDFGEAVTELQKKLHEQGFLSSAYVDGQFGTHTKEAVENFQSTLAAFAPYVVEFANIMSACDTTALVTAADAAAGAGICSRHAGRILRGLHQAGRQKLPD